MFTFKLRRDTIQDWEVKNPVLAQGEPGMDTTTGRFKLGDGVKTWSELPYFVPGTSASGGDPGGSLFDHIYSETPHPVYDDGPSLFLLYENAKV